MGSSKREQIAVIGTACRFPNNINNIEDYWAFLKRGGDAVSEIPKHRWDWKFHFDEEINKIGKSYVNRGSFMDWDIESFDAAFFDISPREAAVLDPQQRLLLEVTFEALEDSVGDISTLRGSQTGVYIGCFMQDNLITQMGSAGSKSQLGTYTAVSSTMTMISNRLSYSFDLKGPSLTMDTACSSSLVALHQACRGLLAGDCDMAVTGGVNVMFRPEVMTMMSKGRFLARDGRSKTFSANADGYGRGEGAGIVVLKRYSDALRDRDTIHGVILGSGVNQDGSTDGITVPSESSQTALARHVYAEANLNPDDIAYLEAHGTGTPVGDPIEMRAMGGAVQRAHDKAPLIVGSVKAGIGHLEAAAGIAGFLKALLIAKHGEIPPQAWLDTALNPAIDFTGLHLRIADKLQPLPSSQHGKSYIAINSFGYGGTNAHVVLSKAPSQDNTNKLLQQTIKKLSAWEAFNKKPLALHFSAASEAACVAYAQTYLAQLAPSDHAHALQLCRDVTHKTQLTHRWAISADSVQRLKGRLLLAIEDKKGEGIVKNRTHQQQQPVFVFSGMGPQWWAMGQELMKTEPLFASTLQAADRLFIEIAGWSILDEMMRPESESRLNATEVAQPANFMLQLGLFELLTSWGVKPSAVIGHSVGEVSAAYASGHLSLKDALRVAYHRSQTQAKTAGTGTMVATALNQDDAETYLQALEKRLSVEQQGKVSLAGINSASNTTLSGDEAIIDQIITELEEKNIFARKLRVEVPYHSAGMDPILEELALALNDISPKQTTIPLYSTVSGTLSEAQGFDAQYWCDNVRQPVYFEKGINNLLAAGHELFLEIGPHPVLSGYIKETILKSQYNGVCFSTLKRKQPEMERLSAAVSTLWTAGVNIDFSHYIGTANPQAGLPAYPWQRKKYWSEEKYDKEVRQGWSKAHPLLGRRLPDPTPSWQSELSPSVMTWLPDHTIGENSVFPGAGYIDTLLAATQEATKIGGNKVLKNIHFHRALLLSPNEDTTLKTTLKNGDHIDIYAGVASKQGQWQQHASADLRSGHYAAPANNPLTLIDANELKRFKSISTETLYATFTTLGLNYGASFRSIKSLKRLDNCAIIDLAVEKDDRHIIHPALLDGAFQSLLALLEETAGSAYLPVHIDGIHLYHPVEHQATALLTLTEYNTRYLKADLSLIVNDKVAVELLGIRCDAAQLATDPLQAELERVSYRLGWYLVGYDDDIVADSHVAIVGDSIPPDLEDGLVELGCENISWFDSIEAFAKIDPINEVEQLLVFIETKTAAEAVDKAAKMVTSLQVLHAAGFSGTLAMITYEALAAEVRYSLPNWSSAWVTGLRRCAHNELAPITLRHIDIDDDMDGYALALEVSVKNAEDEVALSGNERWAMQVTRVTPATYQDLKTKVQKPFIDNGQNSFELNTPAHPSVTSLTFSDVARIAPLKGQIEIKVTFVSLNYKDFSKVSGMLTEDFVQDTNSGMTLGLECEGVVVRVGADVNKYSVGDLVAIASADTFKRYLTVNTNPYHLPHTVIQHQPPQFNAGESAASFVAYGTALWGLKGIAKLRKDESILIHGAAGGVGLAAVHIAHYIGATIIASAGTAEKRAYLLTIGADYVVDSRTLNFATTIKELTHNKGVNVVFNSVGGGIVPTSIEALASFGRFIEIGKSDIFRGATLDLALFEKGVSYSTLDLEYLLLKQPTYFVNLMDKVFHHLSNGNLPALPITTFGADKVQDAFRFLSKSKQIGKVCVDMQITPLVSQYTLRSTDLDPEKCVVITGGLGGVGLMIANWCVDKGAQQLVLLGRTGASSKLAKQAVTALESRGTAVDVYACDVADFNALNEVFTTISTKWVIGGIVHAAGTLDDRSLLALDEAAVITVARPKIMGASNLHHLSKDNTALDFFWALSSIASLSGNTHQANYALANSFMDGLMEARQAAGLPANSIQLGPVANVGMAMANDDLKQYLALRGMHYMEEALMHATFERVMAWNIPIMTMAILEWPVWEFAEPRAASSYRCEVIISEEGADKSNHSTRDVIEQLAQEQRAETVGYILIEHIADILQMETAEIELDAPLDSLGVDSLTAVELQSLINRSLQVEMSILSMLGGKTIIAIAEELIDLMKFTDAAPIVAVAEQPSMVAVKPIAAAVKAIVNQPLKRQA